MRQQTFRRVGEFGCHGNGRPGIIRREPGRSHHGVFNVVSLPTQPAVPVEGNPELTPDG